MTNARETTVTFAAYDVAIGTGEGLSVARAQQMMHALNENKAHPWKSSQQKTMVNTTREPLVFGTLGWKYRRAVFRLKWRRGQILLGCVIAPVDPIEHTPYDSKSNRLRIETSCEAAPRDRNGALAVVLLSEAVLQPAGSAGVVYELVAALHRPLEHLIHV